METDVKRDLISLSLELLRRQVQISDKISDLAVELAIPNSEQRYRLVREIKALCAVPPEADRLARLLTGDAV